MVITNQDARYIFSGTIKFPANKNLTRHVNQKFNAAPKNMAQAPKPEFGLGALKSPADPQELKVETLFAAIGADSKLPKKVDWRKNMPGPRNQGSRWTCSAFVGAAIMAWNQWKTRQELASLWSPEFLYDRRSNFPVRGMFGRDVVAILKNEGCVKEDVWPYEPDREPKNNAMPLDVMDKAKENRIIHTYAAVMTSDGLKRAVATDGPCYISLPCFTYNLEFWKADKANQDSLGGHAITVVGYNGTGFILQNSWGPQWGNKGYTVLPYDDFGLKWESYTCVSQETMKLALKATGPSLLLVNNSGRNYLAITLAIFTLVLVIVAIALS